MIADGDGALREQLEAVCRDAGLDCVSVGSVGDGNAAIDAQAYDVVITDWVLPGGSGIDLATKALDRRPGCGVIVLGATGSLALANNLLHGEVGAFLKKPVSEPAILAETVRTVLDEVKRRPIVDTQANDTAGSLPPESSNDDMGDATEEPEMSADAERRMREERIKSLPATGTERMDAALEREQALVVNEGDLEGVAAGFDDVFGDLDEEAKTRPVKALGEETDQEAESESDRAFRIRFRSVPGFADEKVGTQEDESPEGPPTDPHPSQVLADDDDDPLEISDEDFQMVDDSPSSKESTSAPTSPAKDGQQSGESTVVFASNPDASAVAAEDASAGPPERPSTSVTKPAAPAKEAKATKKKKRRRKAPPPSVGTSTVVTSIVARPERPGDDDKGDRPSILVREPSAPNQAAPASEAAPATTDVRKPVPNPRANRIDTIGGSEKIQVPTQVSNPVDTLGETAGPSAAGDADAVALPSSKRKEPPSPQLANRVDTLGEPVGAKASEEDAVALPSSSTPASSHAPKQEDAAVALPSNQAGGEAVALPSSSPAPSSSHADKDDAVALPSADRALDVLGPAAGKPAQAKRAKDADAGLSDDDIKDLNAAVGGAESAAVAFASEVAGAFGPSEKSGAEDEISFTVDFSEDEPEPEPTTGGPEKTWVVNTQSRGVVSAELNDEVWTLNQPAEKTGIHVLEDEEHYAIERKLADGKHASVYLARWPGDATPVALKVLSPELSQDIKFRQRFRREIRSQAALSHENVVGVVRYGRRSQSYFLAVELMEGTLQDILRALGRLPTAIVCIVLEDVLRGIHYAHRRQVIHRELKPSNVFFAASGAAKVGDFGFAKSVIDPNQSTPGLKLGTPAYFSPEQSMGKEIGPRSDLFAIGTLGYEMLTGKNPYQRDTIVDTAFAVTRASAPEPAAVVPTPHNLLSLLVRKLGAKDPADRYPTALAALEDLAPLVALVNKRYPKLRSQFVHAPKDVARQLNADEARLEVNRAARMMNWGDSHRPRAALCYFRASQLDPKNKDAKEGLAELSSKYGLSFKGFLRKKYGEMEQNLAQDPDNTFLMRELADRARDEGDLWGYARFLRRLLAADPTDQRARNQLDSLIGVDPAAPFGKGRPNPKEQTKIASPKLGQLDREERTGVGLRVPLENKTKLTHAVLERQANQPSDAN